MVIPELILLFKYCDNKLDLSYDLLVTNEVFLYVFHGVWDIMPEKPWDFKLFYFQIKNKILHILLQGGYRTI
jgi:hypothetical protein